MRLIKNVHGFLGRIFDMDLYKKTIPCYLIELTQSSDPITDFVTKFGGKPTWLNKPQWPISTYTQQPMQFICQIVLDGKLFPNALGTIAYIFMANEDDGLSSTWEYEAGDNAVIIQTGKVPPFIKISDKNENELLNHEYSVTYIDHEDVPSISQDKLNLTDEEYEVYMSKKKYTKIGGDPAFLQGDEFPEGENWKLLCQFEESKMPFYINLGGGGIAYVFINMDGTEGRLMWQR
ncbi:MAG: hypothetical protein FADNKDHG_01523 [Holosporales bacterium]